jgi:hypothetical protein
MATAIERLLDDESVRQQVSTNAAKGARQEFDIQLQVEQYLEWYEEILGSALPQTSQFAAAV